MPLRLDLGPFEKLHIGKTVLLNSHERAYFAFEGDVPIMRGKDVLQAELARNSLGVIVSLNRFSCLLINDLPCSVENLFISPFERFRRLKMIQVNRQGLFERHPQLQMEKWTAGPGEITGGLHQTIEVAARWLVKKL
jgi:hypothetical protein